MISFESNHRRSNQSVVLAGLDRKVDDSCGEFEESWKQGHGPTIEDHLSHFTAHERPLAFSRLLDLELRLLRAAGNAPRREDYADRFKEYTDSISKVFAYSDRNRDPGHATTQFWSGLAEIDRSALPGDGDVIDRFVVRGVLGRGGFGTVYRAYDPKLDRDVAVKMPHAKYWQTTQQREYLLDEARAAALLTHPNVCPIYEVGEFEGQPYIVMACIDGQPLSRVIQSAAVVEVHTAVMMVRRIAMTMAEAHLSGAVHRDLKPANILIDRRGNPVLTDFGLAMRDPSGWDGNSDSDKRAGTPPYMSPEQVRGETVGPSSDIYSLGVVLYELLAGRRPFTGGKDKVLHKVVHEDPAPPSRFCQDVTTSLDAICMRALAKDPAHRFASMEELVHALDQVIPAADPLHLMASLDSDALHAPSSSRLATSESSATITTHSDYLPTAPIGSTGKRMLFACALLGVVILAGGLWMDRDPSRSSDAQVVPTPVSPDADVARWLLSISVPFAVRTEGSRDADTDIEVLAAAALPQETYRIIRVDLSRRRDLVDAQLAPLSTLDQLESLYLSDTAFTNDALLYVRDLVWLRELWIDRTQINDEGLAHLSQLTSLMSLSCNGTQISGNGLRYLPSPAALRRLSFKQGNLDTSGVQQLARFTALTHLWLDANQLTDDELRVLAELPDLESLSLMDVGVEGTFLAQLSCPRLEKLALKRTRLRDSAITDLPEFPALAELFVDQTPLGNSGLTAWVDAAPQLQRLSITHTSVGGAAFVNLTNLPQLSMLSLDGLRIKPFHLDALAKIPSLRSLCLRSTRVGTPHVPALAGLKQLRELYLGDTRLTDADRKNLSIFLPDCEIK